ncbi:MAG: sugar phosphate isomerase/epimerase family protein [Pirellulaceae bacterium]|nr:sugar phosphate isomerase/epimerase family protein [Pirellulaceae bacterium]
MTLESATPLAAIPTLSQVCCLNSPFDRDLEDFAAGQCRSIEVWLTKLETYLESHTLADVRFWLERFELSLPVASFQGGLLASQGEARREAWNLFTSRLDLCREVGIGTIAVACDVPAPLSQTTIERVQASLVQVAQEAGRRGLRAALEFQATSAFGNNLQTAAALVSEVGSPHLGICLDAYHWHVGPSKTEDLGYLTPENLFHVQLCDLADVPRELAADSHRILPGEGDIHLSPLIDHLRRIDYRGCVSLELLNPQLWQIPPLQLGEIGMTCLRKLLGQAQR